MKFKPLIDRSSDDIIAQTHRFGYPQLMIIFNLKSRNCFCIRVREFPSVPSSVSSIVERLYSG